MTQNSEISGDGAPIRIDGFNFGAISAEVKKVGYVRLDFGLVVAERPAVAAGVTTRNVVHAAPVTITRKVISGGLCQAVLVNSGNANAYTGPQGMEDAERLVETLSGVISINSGLIIPMSTGVIGARLPVERMKAKIPALVESLGPDGFNNVAQAILTTDTVPKTFQVKAELSTGPFTVAGMCKGAGMIAPNMATMLALLMTDIRVDHDFLAETFKECCRLSFNRITIDGDTSTNDTAVCLSGGALNSRELSKSSRDREIFVDTLKQACLSLAKQIVMDGEGATKFVEVKVISAVDDKSAGIVARKIAESPLVKTAFHGEDPNWGRIICAAGNSGILFDPASVDLFIGDVAVVRDGKLVEDDWEKKAHQVMQNRSFAVTLDLKMGNGHSTIMTSDFSEEYVTINADYRS